MLARLPYLGQSTNSRRVDEYSSVLYIYCDTTTSYPASSLANREVVFSSFLAILFQLFPPNTPLTWRCWAINCGH